MDLELGNTFIVNNKKCTYLNNDYCVFIKGVHHDMKNPMYVEIYNGIMEMRCLHRDCKNMSMSTNKIDTK